MRDLRFFLPTVIVRMPHDRWGQALLMKVYLLAATLWVVGAAIGADGRSWMAGTASERITPAAPMWMAGYASRDRPAEETVSELWAKALVLQDPGGHRVLLVTMDLIGIDRELSSTVCQRLERELDLARDQIALCASHTHSGPVVARNLRPLHYFLLDDVQRNAIDDYAASLVGQISGMAARAIAGLQPVELTWGSGTATFAVNRRENREADVAALRREGRLRGPVDHDVPVLAVRQARGHLLAVVFGYACHATVLSGYGWSGDYPGFAQQALEERYPDATALFWAGCGGDQNPLPRRSVDLARDYGRRLADAVQAELDRPMHAIRGRLKSRYGEIDLPLGPLPSRADLVEQREDDNRYVASRAKMLLARIDSGTELATSYPYPVQTWSIGNDVLLVLLGGEVVVDYALRLKQELSGHATWVAGYSNDVMAYIPSRRVLGEGGYEGGGSMIYYGLPTVWSPRLELMIVNDVLAQAARR